MFSSLEAVVAEEVVMPVVVAVVELRRAHCPWSPVGTIR